MNSKQELRGYLMQAGLLFVCHHTYSQVLRTKEKRVINLSLGPIVEKVALIFDELILPFTAAPLPLCLHVSRPALFLALRLPGSCLLLRTKMSILLAKNPVSISFLFKGGSHQWTYWLWIYWLSKVLITDMKECADFLSGDQCIRTYGVIV